MSTPFDNSGCINFAWGYTDQEFIKIKTISHVFPGRAEMKVLFIRSVLTTGAHFRSVIMSLIWLYLALQTLL